MSAELTHLRLTGRGADRVLGLVVWLPLLTILSLWYPALTSSFQFDDWNVIVTEPRVQSVMAWWQALPSIRPVLKLSYALNFLAGTGVESFRLTNMVIHGINATLILLLIRQRAAAAGLAQARATAVGLLTALCFALHPAQTEAVTYISGRSASLATLFMLLSLWLWCRPQPRPWAMVGSLLAYVTAVACKETALVLPALIWLWQTSHPDRSSSEQAGRVWMLVVIASLLLAAMLGWPYYRRLLLYGFQEQSIAALLATQPTAIGYLLGQVVFIHDMNADPQIVPHLTWDMTAIIGWSVEVTVIGGALATLRRFPIAAFAVLWFWLAVLPMHSLLPRLDLVNDRQLYLALLGPAFWLAWHGVRLAAQWPPRRFAPLAALLATVLLVSLAAATAARNQDYRTEVSFWTKTAQQNPHSARAANNLGQAFWLAQRPADAEREFRRAIALDPDQYQAVINLHLLLTQAAGGDEDPARSASPRDLPSVPPSTAAHRSSP